MAAIFERGTGRITFKLNAGADPNTGKAMLKTVGMTVAGATNADACAAVAAAVVPLLIYPSTETQFAASDTLGDDGN